MSLNQWCYRLELIKLQGMIKQVLNHYVSTLLVIFAVRLAGENVKNHPHFGTSPS